MLCPADYKQDAKEVVDQVDMSTITQLFECSDQLTSTAVVDFVMCLCLVALEEIHHAEPRIFCSEKVLLTTSETSVFSHSARIVTCPIYKLKMSWYAFW